jgi:predicted transcriptional regulator
MMSAMSKRSEKMSCRLEHGLRKKVDEAATATKRSPSEFMRDALEHEVSRSSPDNDKSANENGAPIERAEPGETYLRGL